MKIVKIIIKGESGYGPVDEAYTDKLTITESSISYEYKPHPMSESVTNFYKKWSYKTINPYFAEIFNQIAERTPYYLYNDDILFCTDIGATTITATFEDKHRETVNYFCPSEFFRDYFIAIRELIPQYEDMPAVLWLPEDEKEDL